MSFLRVLTILALAPLPLVTAAESRIVVGKDTYFVHTGTADGQCKVNEDSAGVREVECADGDNWVVLRSDRGCLASNGSGYCGRNVEWKAGLWGSQLNCPGGVSYFLTSGVVGQTCVNTVAGKECRSADGLGSAAATCEHGCGNTSMGGTCCQVASGCPPKSDC